MTRSALALLWAALLAGCATSPRPALRAEPTPYAFVVLGEDGRAIARVITSAPVCPAIELDGVIGEPMEVRALPATMPLRRTRGDPAESKPSAFPVLVCEQTIPAGTTRAAIAGQRLPLPKANPRRIVVIGDTGCRIKAAERVFQACSDSARWPFAAVAAAASAAEPDLVIHVGDYHYRENACPPGNTDCVGSPWGYGWDAWEADVFAPNPEKPDVPFPGNSALQSVLSGLQPGGLFPRNVQALVAGHVHLFEVASFSTPQPPQFVTGNGGDWVDTPLPLPLPSGVVPAPGTVLAALVATNRFGFMTMERDGPRWKMVAHDVRGIPMIACVLFERHATCEAAPPSAS